VHGIFGRVRKIFAARITFQSCLDDRTRADQHAVLDTSAHAGKHERLPRFDPVLL